MHGKVQIIAGLMPKIVMCRPMKKLVFAGNLLDSLSDICIFSCNHLIKEVIHVCH